MIPVHDEVKTALEQLGYKDPDFKVEHRDCSYYNVFLKDEYFGIWDRHKRTFVD